MLKRLARLPLLWLMLAAIVPPACTPSPAPQTSSAAPALPPYLRQDLYPRWIDAQAQVRWPPDNGCAAAPVASTIPPNTLIDRFGSENGTFVSPKGQPFAARAVPYVCEQMAYTVYLVTRPLPVQSCKAAPWFGEPGGATQYQTAEPASKLRESGAIQGVANDASGNAQSAPQCAGS